MLVWRKLAIMTICRNVKREKATHELIMTHILDQINHGLLVLKAGADYDKATHELHMRDKQHVNIRWYYPVSVRKGASIPPLECYIYIMVCNQNWINSFFFLNCIYFSSVLFKYLKLKFLFYVRISVVEIPKDFLVNLNFKVD